MYIEVEGHNILLDCQSQLQKVDILSLLGLLAKIKRKKWIFYTVWRCLKKFKIRLLYDPAIPLLGKEVKSPFQRDIWTPIFIGTLFTIVKAWKQPKCLSVDEWIKKIW